MTTGGVLVRIWVVRGREGDEYMNECSGICGTRIMKGMKSGRAHLFGDVGECLERDEDLFVVRGVDEGLEVRRAREDEAVQAVRSVQHDLRARMNREWGGELGGGVGD